MGTAWVPLLFLSPCKHSFDNQTDPGDGKEPISSSSAPLLEVYTTVHPLERVPLHRETRAKPTRSCPLTPTWGVMPPPVSQLSFQNEGISNQRLHELPAPELLKFPTQRLGSSPVRTFLAGATPWVRFPSMAKREVSSCVKYDFHTDKIHRLKKNISLPLGSNRLEAPWGSLKTCSSFPVYHVLTMLKSPPASWLQDC